MGRAAADQALVSARKAQFAVDKPTCSARQGTAGVLDPLENGGAAPQRAQDWLSEPAPKQRGGNVKITWKNIAPLCLWLAIYLVPVPAGLNANQWHYFALFAAVIVGLILESMPVGAIGLIGLTVAGVLGYVESDPNKSLRWMLGGFSEGTVWLIVGAFVFSIGYRKSGLGKRLALILVPRLGRSTIGLGYAVALSDLVLAPATPS